MTQEDENAFTTANMMRRVEQGWAQLNDYVGGLSDQQLTGPTDAAGWTAKDHLIHLALWEDSLVALLKGQSRAESIGVDEETWEQGADPVNAILQQRYRDTPLQEANAIRERSHGRMLSHLKTLTDDDILRPYSHYQPGSDTDEPVIAWIAGNSFGHYAEHLPWIIELVERGQAAT